ATAPRTRLNLTDWTRPAGLIYSGFRRRGRPRLVIREGTAPFGGNMNWAIPVVAGVFEIGWAIGLKYTEGFTRLWPSVATGLSMLISVWLLGIAMKTLPVGTAYAIWVGIGAMGTVVLGILLFDDPASPLRLISLLLIGA